VGNFSAIPPDRLSQLVVTSELWNHYAAAVFHARLPVHTVPADRARRLSGHSKMSFIALVRHGMSAMSVFGDVVGVRLLAASSGLVALVLLGLVGAISSGGALAGWLLPLLGLALVLALQIGTICALFVFGTLQARSGVAFLPARDYRWFVERVEASE
jgi:hypothetical protein